MKTLHKSLHEAFRLKKNWRNLAIYFSSYTGEVVWGYDLICVTLWDCFEFGDIGTFFKKGNY